MKLAADAVARTSSEVNAAATQSGTASTQIAATINQVASGAAEQAQAATSTSNAVSDLNVIIGQVGSGAGEITSRVEAASAANGPFATVGMGISMTNTSTFGRMLSPGFYRLRQW